MSRESGTRMICDYSVLADQYVGLRASWPRTFRTSLDLSRR
jgi:hypothetical protein